MDALRGDDHELASGSSLLLVPARWEWAQPAPAQHLVTTAQLGCPLLRLLREHGKKEATDRGVPPSVGRSLPFPRQPDPLSRNLQPSQSFPSSIFKRHKVGGGNNETPRFALLHILSLSLAHTYCHYYHHHHHHHALSLLESFRPCSLRRYDRFISAYLLSLTPLLSLTFPAFDGRTYTFAVRCDDCVSRLYSLAWSILVRSGWERY